MTSPRANEDEPMTGRGSTEASRQVPRRGDNLFSIPEEVGDSGNKEASQPQLVTDDRHVPCFQDFVQRISEKMPHLLRKGTGYDNVVACFTTWRDTDRDEITSAAGELKNVLSEKYKYDVRDIVLESLGNEDDPARDFNAEVAPLVRTVSKMPGKSLFILYYGGHCRVTKNGETIWYDRNGWGPSFVRWKDIVHAVKLIACDILFIFDCCFASTIVERDTVWARRCEILCASGVVEQAGGKANNFTRAVASLLEDCVEDPKSAVQVYWSLSEKNFCRSFGLVATPQWYDLTKDSLLCRKILLAPISPKDNSSQKTASTNSASFLGASSTPSSSVSSSTDGADIGPLIKKTHELSTAHVLLAVHFTNPDEQPLVNEWMEWLGNRPQNISDINLSTTTKCTQYLHNTLKCQVCFQANSVLCIVSMPIWIWSCLGPGSAWTYIDTIGSDNNMLGVRETVDGEVSSISPKATPLLEWLDETSSSVNYISTNRQLAATKQGQSDTSLSMKVRCAFSLTEAEDHCSGSFPSNARHKEHLRTRHDVQIVSCNDCHLCFSTTRERQEHKKSGLCQPSSSADGELVALQWRGIVRYVFPSLANYHLPSPYVPSFRDALGACKEMPESIKPKLMPIVDETVRKLGLTTVAGVAREILTETGIAFANAFLEGLADLDAETVAPVSADASQQGDEIQETQQQTAPESTYHTSSYHHSASVFSYGSQGTSETGDIEMGGTDTHSGFPEPPTDCSGSGEQSSQLHHHHGDDLPVSSDDRPREYRTRRHVGR